MALLLCLETATKNCSVAVSRNGECIALKEFADSGYAHAEKLHVFIQDVLSEAGFRFSDLDAVAVSKGPGSYTGLRIGVSAAKGLCFALGIPLIAIDTLKILSAQSGISEGLIVPMLDARRMEVYSAVFDANLSEVRGIKAEILDEHSFSELEGKVFFAGDANEKAKTLLTSGNFEFLDSVGFPSAKAMCVLAEEKYTASAFEDVAYFEPFYLKDFVVTSPKS